MPNQPRTDSTSACPAMDDCWNKIGVQGDGSCPELAQHIHCHNCPVYSAAAGTFLDRDLPGNYLAEWTRHFAREKPVVEQNTLSVVLFRLDAEWFALPVTVFKEISELKTIHSLPHRRDNLVLGLVNFRGELLICVSLARMLGFEESPEIKAEPRHAVHPYLLIISDGGHRLVFPVDEVGGIHHFHLQEVKKLPATVSGAHVTFTTGIVAWRNQSVGCLDAGLLFHTLGQEPVMSTKDFSDFSMFELFRIEADNQTKILTSGLLVLECDHGAAGQTEALMRAAHSLKGAARIVDLHAAVRVSHAMEDCFVAAQKGKVVLGQKQIDLLLSGVDLL